jgi:cellulose synthase/poly-beta-1,6-N-acetylglucosamine synthase-like glycosyltransferase
MNRISKRDRALSSGEAQPLVSVVVPAWNAELTIEQTLRSVASQTYRNLEILIVDDGSTDQTAAVAEQFCAAEPRGRLIRKENGGVASARNRGIAEAKGEWIAPVDADDLWHPTKIQKQLAVARAASDRPGFVYCWRRLIDRDGRIVASGLRCAFEGSAFTRLGYVNAVECGSSLLIARKVLLEIGGYDETLRARHAQGCEDMLLQLKIARRFPIAVVREHLVAWRLHDTNMSSDFDQMARSFSLVLQKLAAEGTAVPPLAARRAMAKIVFELAEQRAVTRRIGAMIACLSRAVALDPLRSGALLAYRAARFATGRLRSARTSRPSLRFEEVDPAAELSMDPMELRVFSRLLKRWEEKRLSGLAEVEPEFIAPAPASVG